MSALAKAKVTELDVLEAAELTYNELKAADEQATIDAAIVDAVIGQIGTVTLDSKNAIETARSAYNKLSDLAKSKVTQLSVLEAAEQAYLELKQEDDEAAEQATVVDGYIEAIGTVTLNSGEAITIARNAYNALSDLAKSKVTKLDVLIAAETRLATLQFEDAKEQKKVALSELVDINEYRKAEQDMISQILLDADNAIDEATTLEQVDEIFDLAKTEIESLKTKKEYEEEEAKNKKGCGGSIATTSSLLFIASVIGITFLIVKNKRRKIEY